MDVIDPLAARVSSPPPPALAPAERPWLSGAVVVCFACALLVVIARRYMPFLADDAFISLRYAWRLIHGDGLTWTAGERVEGYTNLLWTLLAAGAGVLGANLVTAVRVMGLLSCFAMVVAIVYAHPARRFVDALPSLAAASLLAICGPIAVWSIGGLEQPLVGALLAWAVVLGYAMLDDAVPPRAWLAPSILLALLCWTRADGALFTVAMAIGLVLARGMSRSTLVLVARLVALPMLAVAADIGFRLVYYHDWLPNSAYAKVAFTAARLHTGLRYVVMGLAWLSPLVVPAIAGLAVAWFSPRGARRARFLAMPLVLWFAYVITIGGDVFPAHRQLVCVLVVLALATALGFEVVLRARPAWRPVLWTALPALLAVAWVALEFDPDTRLAREEHWEWEHQVLGTFLKTAFGAQQPLLASDAAGALPYFSELPAIDMLGINDHYLAHHRPRNFGDGWLGHELGDGRYVIERKPDLVLFVMLGAGSKPFFRGDREMIAYPDFYRCYRRVTFEGDAPFMYRSQLWVRAEDGRLGIVRTRDRVVVPGYLLVADPGSVAKLDHAGRAAVAVVDTVPAAIEGLRLDGGRWSVHFESTGGAAVASVRSGTDNEWRTAQDNGPLAIDVPRDDTLGADVAVAAAGPDTVFVTRVVLERETDRVEPPR